VRRSGIWSDLQRCRCPRDADGNQNLLLTWWPVSEPVEKNLAPSAPSRSRLRTMLRRKEIQTEQRAPKQVVIAVFSRLPMERLWLRAAVLTNYCTQHVRTNRKAPSLPYRRMEGTA